MYFEAKKKNAEVIHMLLRDRLLIHLALHLSETAREGCEIMSTAQLQTVADGLQELTNVPPPDAFTLCTEVLGQLSETLQTAIRFGGVQAGVVAWTRLHEAARAQVLAITEGTADAEAGDELWKKFEEATADLLEPTEPGDTGLPA